MLPMTAVAVGDKNKGGGITTDSCRSSGSGDLPSQLLELASSEYQKDRAAFYRRTTSLFQALRWYRRFCIEDSGASPSLALEAIGIAVCLTEECLALLQRINPDAYGLFLEIREGGFPFHMDEMPTAN